MTHDARSVSRRRCGTCRVLALFGLLTLQAAQGTPVVANGTVSNRTFTVSTVLAGSSVPWASGDVVSGVVTARNGDSLSWRGNGGSADPFGTVAQDRLDVDLTGARHSLSLLGIPRDALGDDDRIALSGPTDVRGGYMVAVRGANEVQLFRDFAGLTPELSHQLAAGNRLVQINAVGRYNATALELTTPRASFEFITP